MDEQLYFAALGSVDTGKRIGGSLYLHRCAVQGAVEEIAQAACLFANQTWTDVDVLKLELTAPQVSLLCYPGFWNEAFPRLTSAVRVDLLTGATSCRVYDSDSNVPILHRKERMLPLDHPRRDGLTALSRAAEEAGLFDDASIIGHAWQWEEELRARGLQVDGHRLIPRADADDDGLVVQRHRTALRRHKLSTPTQALWRHGFVANDRTFFDYGCGRADDLELLGKIGVQATGWDPYWLPDGERVPADVVNLGFVINVIEDVSERREALIGAWELTRHVLAVAALIGGRTAYEKYRLLHDGVLTTRGTFQKYFTHGELGAYIEDTLGREPVSVAPGLYFVFRTDEGEQSFLEERQRSRARPIARSPQPRRVRPTAGRTTTRRTTRWVRHAELLEAYWQRCLRLGRAPVDGEFVDEAAVRKHLGTAKTVLRHLSQLDDDGLLDAASHHRRRDLLVYLALNLFERRRSFGSLSERVRADIKAFWGSYAGAIAEAKELLFSISDHAAITRAAWDAADEGYGLVEGGRHSLTVEAGLVNELPAVLRIYVGCAGKLYGEAEEADLVRLHLRSGKVTFLLCDDYAGQEVPNLIERVKVNLRRQNVRWFEYGSEEFPVQPIVGKGRFGRQRCADLLDVDGGDGADATESAAAGVVPSASQVENA